MPPCSVHDLCVCACVCIDLYCIYKVSIFWRKPSGSPSPFQSNEVIFLATPPPFRPIFPPAPPSLCGWWVTTTFSTHTQRSSSPFFCLVSTNFAVTASGRNLDSGQHTCRKEREREEKDAHTRLAPPLAGKTREKMSKNCGNTSVKPVEDLICWVKLLIHLHI